MSTDIILELQQQRDALKSNIQDVDENIKKLTGRDPAESRRLQANRRIQLKRNSFGQPDSNQTPIKRSALEKRRWGITALKPAGKLDSGGEENEEKKPIVHSSVVATGKPIEPLQKPIIEDVATKSRNKRMFGLLVGTLKQFKKESQVKTVQEAKREEKLIKVEEQVQKDKVEALEERKKLYQTRRNKQQELQKLEFKLEMAELSVDIKAHYGKFKDLIRLKSTPRVFYKPAIHNGKTEKLLAETKEMLEESLKQRIKEIEMCTEEDIKVSSSRSFLRNRGPGKSAKDPIVIDSVPSKRDLFAEDADNDKRERESIQNNHSKEDNESVVEINSTNLIANGVHKETIDTTHEDLEEETGTIVVGEGAAGDKRRVVSDTSYSVVDERVVEMKSGDTRNIDVGSDKGADVSKSTVVHPDDDVNIYEDMNQDMEMFQQDDSELMEQ